MQFVNLIKKKSAILVKHYNKYDVYNLWSVDASNIKMYNFIFYIYIYKFASLKKKFTKQNMPLK